MSKLMEELIEEDRIEIAEEMLKEVSLSIELIARFSRLPLERVKELASHLHPQMA